MIWMLFACSPDSLTLTDPTDLSGFLAPGTQHAIPERARLRWVGEAAVGWGADAVPLPGVFAEEPVNIDMMVVEQTDTTVAVVSSTRDWRLLMTVQRGDLWPVLSESAFTTASPDLPEAESGIQFPAGTVVDEDVRYGDAPLVRAGGWDLWLPGLQDGWALPEQVDTIYHQPTTTERFEFAFDAVLPSGPIVLLDAPDGAPIHDEWSGYTQHARVLQKEGSWSLVEVAREELRVRGYVPSDTVQEVEPGTTWTRAFRCGTSRLQMLRFGLPEAPNLPAGTWLYADPDGYPIGVTRRPMDAEVLDTDYGWELIELQTAWGPVEVWLDPDQEYDDPNIWQIDFL